MFESFEIYNEEIYDLLNTKRQKLLIRNADKRNYVVNLDQIELLNNDDF